MKSIKLMSLGLVVLSAVALGAPSVQAADPVAETNADVKFVEDKDPITPDKPDVVDPTKPTEPGKGIDPDGNGSGGNGTKSFNINWVSNFKFGEIKIGSTNMTAFAAPTTLKWTDGSEPTTGLANFLQVTDNRGTNAGWNVSVEGSAFKELDESSNPTTTELKGASITLNDAQIVGDTDGAALAPTAVSVGEDILATGSHTVLDAGAGKGQGTWAVTWGADTDKTTLKMNDDKTNATAGVQLSVPVTAQPKADKSYRSTLTWKLVTAPTN
ncbi:WxL domain-containing protein [Enterococcus ureasiticus]|uniref:WxL domain-containing protein n=1 Tax=Enterococcus ureasiticus TaxID=903984 RepID=A0A1E5GHB8_9ENTE|nr:WxL domain-containing protein [Enterococcus ureasiticus]OEG12114.1 hypothetical protein BCR21_07710 [Enterococcus ureasiticus]